MLPLRPSSAYYYNAAIRNPWPETLLTFWDDHHSNDDNRSNLPHSVTLHSVFSIFDRLNKVITIVTRALRVSIFISEFGSLRSFEKERCTRLGNITSVIYKIINVSMHQSSTTKAGRSSLIILGPMKVISNRIYPWYSDNSRVQMALNRALQPLI